MLLGVGAVFSRKLHACTLEAQVVIWHEIRHALELHLLAIGATLDSRLVSLLHDESP